MAEANQASLSLLGLALASTEYPVEARPRLFLDPPLLLKVAYSLIPLMYIYPWPWSEPMGQYL